MNPLLKGYYILRYLGPRVVWLRAGVYLQKSLGISNKVFEPQPWDRIDLARIIQPGVSTDAENYARYKRENPPPFLFPLGKPPEIPAAIRGATTDRQPNFAERLKLLAEDRCVYFFHTPSPARNDWYVNPFNGKRSKPGGVWSDTPDFSPEQGDMRVLWEPSRAAWAIDLARARAHGLEVDAARLFWHWLDSWMTDCPPWLGFQWRCGQESSVRMIAVAFGFWCFANDAATTPTRWVQFARLAWATGYRVAHHINYAISQKNNHALSEAVGLMLISQLFPEFRESTEWRSVGRRLLTQEIRRQVYSDGSYVQHSMNYERVMLHVAMLGLRLAELSGEPLDRDIYERVGRCGEFMFQMMDPETGHVPNYGNNDGACVLPLSECDFSDYRPAVQAAFYLVNHRRLLSPGPWDEDLVWLCGENEKEARRHGDSETLNPQLSPSPCLPVSKSFEDGGYYTLRRENMWAMIRCHTYRDRMGQYDPLQLDLWWRGQNIVQDCGSYLYYDPERPKLEHYFKSLAAHNTIQLDEAEPLKSASRFLWLPWSKARKRHFQGTGPAIWFEGEHDDYDRPPWHVIHRRTVISLEGDLWVVVDDLLGSGEHRAVLRWHLIDVPFTVHQNQPHVTLKTPKGVFSIAVASKSSTESHNIVRGQISPERVQGFAAPYYFELQPIPTLEVTYKASLPLRIVTAMAPASSISATCISEDSQGEIWELVTDHRTLIDLAPCARNTERTYLGFRSEERK